MNLSRSWLYRSSVLVSTLLFVGCTDSEVPTRYEIRSSDRSTWFINETKERGVTFEHLSGAAGKFWLPEITGGGIVLFDMDMDDDLDLYFVQSGSWEVSDRETSTNELYENDGNAQFTLVKTPNPTAHEGYGMGGTAGDYDNDGDIDLYITNLGSNKLLRNDGGGEFVDVAQIAGVDYPGWGTAATFLDIDQDYDLDLFLVNYLHWSPATFLDCFTSNVQTYCLPSHDNAAADQLFLNNGDGSFTNITSEAGFDAAFGNGLGVVSADFNGDGWIDIFVANDGMFNQLWLNNGDLTFSESAQAWNCAMDDHAITKAGMGIATADPDFDGDFDVLVVNIQSQTDSFYRNDGAYFSDRTSAVGLGALSRRHTRFGVVLNDFDNDGFLDLYEANGKVYHEPEDQGPDVFAEPNTLYKGTPSSTFEPIPRLGDETLSLTHTSRGVASGDLDRDGRLDLVVVNKDSSPYILMNRTSTPMNWIQFRLVDSTGRDSYGAELRGLANRRKVLTMVQTAGSYLASNDPVIHIGLAAESTLRDVQVSWINGEVENFGDFKANQRYVLREGSATTSELRTP